MAICLLVLLFFFNQRTVFCFAGSTALGADPALALPSPDQPSTIDQPSMMQNTASLNDQAESSEEGFTNTGPLRPVRPRDFVHKLVLLVNEMNALAASIIVPLAVFGITVSCIFLALGCLIGWQAVKRLGWGGLLTSCLGLLVFYGIPLIIGLIRAFISRLA